MSWWLSLMGVGDFETDLADLTGDRTRRQVQTPTDQLSIGARRDSGVIANEPRGKIDDQSTSVIERLTRLFMGEIKRRRQILMRTSLDRGGNDMERARNYFKRVRARDGHSHPR
jgi:hypothetical protein